MNSIYSINPEINKRDIIAIWGMECQELFTFLINLGARVNAFCIDDFPYDSFWGKEVITIIDLINRDSYALLVNVCDYDEVIERYAEYGLKEENVFVYIKAEEQLIYV